MTKILKEGTGYQILYKERGEDSVKIASSGMACLSRLDVPVPGIIAAADSGKRIRLIDKKYYLVCQGRFFLKEKSHHVTYVNSFYLQYLIHIYD